MGTVGEVIQARIAAQERFDAIVYGQRTLEAMGGHSYGISAEWGAADWALAQWDAAKAAAASFGIDLDGSADEWRLRQAKKAATEARQAADGAVKAIGTKRQQRLALAA